MCCCCPLLRPALAIANLGMLKRCLQQQEWKDRGMGDRGGGGYLYMELIIPRLSSLISRPAIIFSIPLFIRHFKHSLIIHKVKTKGIYGVSLYLIKPRLKLRPIFKTKKPSNLNISARMS